MATHGGDTVDTAIVAENVAVQLRDQLDCTVTDVMVLRVGFSLHVEATRPDGLCQAVALVTKHTGQSVTWTNDARKALCATLCVRPKLPGGVFPMHLKDNACVRSLRWCLLLAIAMVLLVLIYRITLALNLC
jgi:hypothetical protein